VSFIKNASDTPLDMQASGTLPNVGGALLNWFQPMRFGIVTTNVVGFQSVQKVEYIDLQGVMQPLSQRRLQLKPEGQRAWSWWWLHAAPAPRLRVDFTVIYRERQYRVMSSKNYGSYGYIEYELVQDWTGSGPSEQTAP
jgi:hypothetical protein